MKNDLHRAFAFLHSAFFILHSYFPLLLIRRLVDRHRAYTAIFLKGEPPKIFPTSDYEHARILQIYKQDKPYEGIHNDYTDYSFGMKQANE